MPELLRREDFEPLAGRTVEIEFGEAGWLAVELERVEPLPRRGGAEREPFSLLFRAPASAPPEQRIYRVRHQALGETGIFLVPIGRDEAGVRFEAVFA